MSKYFCFGLGYVAKAFAHAVGHDFSGTSRTPGPNVYKFDSQTPVPRDVLFEHTHFLISIPPEASGDLVLKLHRQDFLDHPNLQWIGYLSSTGVYGDKQGDWVDEASPCLPSDAVSQARLVAETEWLDLYKKHNLPVHVFRLAGIYGPGRSMVDRIRAGQVQRIDKPGQYFSRIHVEDIVQVLQASIKHPAPGQIYNLADDHPCFSREVIEYVCDQLSLEYPPLIPFEEADLSTMAKRFYRDNRRICNTKIKSELGVVLKFSNYKEGLAIISS